MKKLLLICMMSFGFANLSQAQHQNTKIVIGEDAPELKYDNPDGKPISLKEASKGKYVLIDFWASWCGPCRRVNPDLVKLYDQYSTKKFQNSKKGFTIFSVSLDRNKDSWVKAIASDNLKWEYHVSDLLAWKSEAAAIYGVNYIPQAFLIGPDGKVIAKYNNVLDARKDLDKFLK